MNSYNGYDDVGKYEIKKEKTRVKNILRTRAAGEKKMSGEEREEMYGTE